MTTRELEHPENGRISADATVPKVSVIVPVFNPGPGFERCLESLRGQTLSGIEMIFVDDCGTDGAMDKVRAAAAEDSRIRIITNPENLGPGPARNAGIEAARGEYLSFVDADDYVSPDFLELLYHKAHTEGLDIAKGTRISELDDGTTCEDRSKLNDRILSGLAERPLYALFRWEHQAGLYRRVLLMESGVRYGSPRNAEDVTFLLRACNAAGSFGMEVRAVYHYMFRKESLSNVRFARRSGEQLESLKQQLDYCVKQIKHDENLVEYVVKRIEWNLRLHLLVVRSRENEADADDFLAGIREQALRLPFQSEVKKLSRAVRALADYGVNLIASPYLGHWKELDNADISLDIAKRWCDFALAHPELLDEYGKDLSQVLQNAAEAVMQEKYGTENQCIPLSEPKEQIGISEPLRCPKVSVIVPVWNPGQGIERCLESLRGQTLLDIELIFVDDLGTDGAMDKVRAAAGEDPRIRVITNPENLGAGPSRNAGIEAARGEYLSFVDADDYVSPDFLELLYHKAHTEGLDIAKGTRIAELGDGTLYAPPSLNDVILSGLAAGRPLYTLFSWEHQSGLYRRALLMESGARYGTSRKTQDVTFLLRACHAARTFGIEERAVYHYVCQNSSTVNTFNVQNLRGECEALAEQFDHLVGRIAPSEHAEIYALDRIRTCLEIQAYVAGLPGLEEAADEFFAGIREQALRLPFIESMKARFCDVRALVDYGVGLPRKLYAGHWRDPNNARARLDLARRWCDFALAHPELVDEYGEGLQQVLKNAADAVAREMKYGPRIDVKIYDTENSKLELRDVSDKAKVTTPAWLYKSRQPGTGYVVEPYPDQTEIKLDFLCKTGGEFTAALRGADVRGSSGKRIPKWVTYTGLACNGEAVFEGEQRAWHDQPYRYTKTVQAGDAVTLEVRWNPS